MDYSSLSDEELKDVYRRKKDEISRYDNLQMAKKISMNSGYGALANIYNRWYRREFAEAITSSGQLSTRWVERHLNYFLNTILETEDVDYVIACDTDSVYLNLNAYVKAQCPYTDPTEIVKWLEERASDTIQPQIDKSFDQLAKYVNAREQKMVMKREVIADKGIWTAKKRYMLHVLNEEGFILPEAKMKIMGSEAIRTSTPGICRTMIKDTLRVILEKDQAAMQDKIAQCEAEFVKQPFEVVAFPRSVSSLHKWVDRSSVYKKGTPIHVKGALMYNHSLSKYGVDKVYQEITEGQKIKFAYLKPRNPIHTNVISCPDKLPPEFRLDEYVDHYKQFEKAYLEPIKTVADAIGWDTHPKYSLEEELYG